MRKFDEFKKKVKDNKGKIIAGIVFISGVAYVVVKQNGTIKELKLDVSKQSKTIGKQQEDIDTLKHVMNGTVLASLKETLTKKLRYREGRLSNGLKDGVITKVDEMKLREEIEYFSGELKKIFEAEKLLND